MEISRNKVKLSNSSGNLIDSHLSSDGGYHLGTAFIQSVYTSTNNSTTENLDSLETFTGTSEETLGINGIQIYHFADQDCTINLQQSLDNNNWDIQDSFECLANQACTRTFISVAPYFRLLITNNGLVSTTEIRTGVGMTPVINPLPRALTDDGRLKNESTLAGKENTDRHVFVSPTNQLSSVSNVRLIGTNFDGTDKDPNFWTTTVTNNGTVTQSGGEIELATSTTADGTAKYQSTGKARFVVGSANFFVSGVNFVTAGTTDNIRRVGAYNTTDGFFFQLDGTTFSIGTRKSSSDTLVNSGSFNGNYGPSFIISADTYYKFDIEWTPLGVFYYINGKLLHKILEAHLTNALTLNVTIENINDNSNDTNVLFDCVGAVILRQGKLETNANYYHLSGNAATHILKYGAGVLQKIMFNNTSGTSITIYDNTAASGAVIGIITTASAALGEWTYNIPFSNGLTFVTVGNSLDATIIYE